MCVYKDTLYKDNLGEIIEKTSFYGFYKVKSNKKKIGLHFFLQKNYRFFKKYGKNILEQIAKDNLGKLA
jgi:hypothetical protein